MSETNEDMDNKIELKDNKNIFLIDEKRKFRLAIFTRKRTKKSKQNFE